jgi:hypothetical protein
MNPAISGEGLWCQRTQFRGRAVAIQQREIGLWFSRADKRHRAAIAGGVAQSYFCGGKAHWEIGTGCPAIIEEYKKRALSRRICDAACP